MHPKPLEESFYREGETLPVPADVHRHRKLKDDVTHHFISRRFKGSERHLTSKADICNAAY